MIYHTRNRSNDTTESQGEKKDVLMLVFSTSKDVLMLIFSSSLKNTGLIKMWSLKSLAMLKCI